MVAPPFTNVTKETTRGVGETPVSPACSPQERGDSHLLRDTPGSALPSGLTRATLHRSRLVAPRPSYPIFIRFPAWHRHRALPVAEGGHAARPVHPRTIASSHHCIRASSHHCIRASSHHCIRASSHPPTPLRHSSRAVRQSRGSGS